MPHIGISPLCAVTSRGLAACVQAAEHQIFLAASDWHCIRPLHLNGVTLTDHWMGTLCTRTTMGDTAPTSATTTVSWDVLGGSSTLHRTLPHTLHCTLEQALPWPWCQHTALAIALTHQGRDAHWGAAHELASYPKAAAGLQPSGHLRTRNLCNGVYLCSKAKSPARGRSRRETSLVRSRPASRSAGRSYHIAPGQFNKSRVVGDMDYVKVQASLPGIHALRTRPGLVMEATIANGKPERLQGLSMYDAKHGKGVHRITEFSRLAPAAEREIRNVWAV
ncbi:uncharacterized protein HaLaN_05483 [Haematococcus lacustris]|uniref:Uncharacterized protein n=1 Tax=Haematococcus lacustris TaxID=44745 RepID=A0A699YJB9_HAELA|nr:uncharacterized protein HaLaN_05483 [Haematococcus lacustris]